MCLSGAKALKLSPGGRRQHAGVGGEEVGPSARVGETGRDGIVGRAGETERRNRARSSGRTNESRTNIRMTNKKIHP